MTVLLSILAFFTGLGLLIFASMRPQPSLISRFELQRRAKDGDNSAESALERDRRLSDIQAFIRVTVTILVVFLTIELILIFGLILGGLLSVAISLIQAIGWRVSWFDKFAQKKYLQLEPRLLELSARYPQFFKLIREKPKLIHDGRVESRVQLLHLVETSGDVLTVSEKRLIKHGLKFGGIAVSSVMTPLANIDGVKKSELLGPLVLDDLHKTGHSRFPVYDGQIDNIIGILHIRDLLTVDSGKSSTTAEKSMEPRVYYIRENQMLDSALAMFLRTHHHMLIVVNEDSETVGLLTLEDVIEKLLGRRISDEIGDRENL